MEVTPTSPHTQSVEVNHCGDSRDVSQSWGFRILIQLLLKTLMMTKFSSSRIVQCQTLNARDAVYQTHDILATIISLIEQGNMVKISSKHDSKSTRKSCRSMGSKKLLGERRLPVFLVAWRSHRRSVLLSPSIPRTALTHPSQPPPLNFTQRLGTRHESHRSYSTRNRQRLEQIPSGIVHKEHTFHRNDAAKEQGMRNGRSLHCLAQVIDVGSQRPPDDEEHGKTGQYCAEEEERDNFRWRTWVGPELVVNFGQSTVAEWFLDGRRWDVRVVSDLEIEGVGFVRGGCTEGGDGEVCLEWGGGDEELGGNIIVCL